MKMLSTQWKYHDPAGSYWTTVEECYTLMAVGRIHHGVPMWSSSDSDNPLGSFDLKLTARCNDDRKEYLAKLETAHRAREFEQETAAAIEKSLASNQDNNPLYHVDAEAKNQRLFEIQVEEATSHSLQDVRAAPPIYDDLHSCVGWSPTDSLPTVFGSSTCSTMRSMCLERDVHSSSPGARVSP